MKPRSVESSNLKPCIWIELIALVVGAAVGVSYYQLYFVSEYNATPRYLIYNPASQLNLLFHNW
ncbi:MAG: hypothetical protein E6L05_02930 [Thaumarchaeota archaeon]|nr:MAG: hypothetical protein E6L05_02930 [Nitrososphaerota archaeon]